LCREHASERGMRGDLNTGVKIFNRKFCRGDAQTKILPPQNFESRANLFPTQNFSAEKYL